MLTGDYEDGEFELQSAVARGLVSNLSVKCRESIEGSLAAGEGTLALEDAAHFVEFYGATVSPRVFDALKTLVRDYPRRSLPALIETLRTRVEPTH